MSAGKSPVRSGTWAVVVLWFIALNLLDLGLTLHLVSNGAVEMNPIMSSVLDRGWEWAALFKVTTTTGVAAGLWFGRQHVLVRRTGVAFVALLALVAAYQTLDVWVAA